MSSDEGDYIMAKKFDGTPIRIEWFDKGSSIPGFWTTVFKAEDWEGASQIDEALAEAVDDPAAFRLSKDYHFLESKGIDTSTIIIHQPRFEV